MNVTPLAVRSLAESVRARATLFRQVSPPRSIIVPGSPHAERVDGSDAGRQPRRTADARNDLCCGWRRARHAEHSIVAERRCQPGSGTHPRVARNQSRVTPWRDESASPPAEKRAHRTALPSTATTAWSATLDRVVIVVVILWSCLACLAGTPKPGRPGPLWPPASPLPSSRPRVSNFWIEFAKPMQDRRHQGTVPWSRGWCHSPTRRERPRFWDR